MRLKPTLLLLLLVAPLLIGITQCSSPLKPSINVMEGANKTFIEDFEKSGAKLAPSSSIFSYSSADPSSWGVFFPLKLYNNTSLYPTNIRELRLTSHYDRILSSIYKGWPDSALRERFFGILINSEQRLLKPHIVVHTENVVPASKILSEIAIGTPVEYYNVTIKGDLDLSKVDLPKDMDKFSIINSQINISKSRIRGAVNFSSILFQKSANFNGTLFNENSSFENAWFSGDICFRGARFNGNAKFLDVQFSRYANFTDAQFNRIADFRGGKFKGDTTFSDAQFNRLANFTDAQFNRNADFTGGKFKGDTTFSDAQFNRLANFTDAQFSGITDFKGVQFNRDTRFWDAQFNGLANFTDAQFNRNADFTGGKFKGDTTFSDAQFNGLANFTDAQFSGITDFTGIKFNREVYGDTWFKLMRVYNARNFISIGLFIVILILIISAIRNKTILISILLWINKMTSRNEYRTLRHAQKTKRIVVNTEDVNRALKEVTLSRPIRRYKGKRDL